MEDLRREFVRQVPTWLRNIKLLVCWLGSEQMLNKGVQENGYRRNKKEGQGCSCPSPDGSGKQ